MGKPAIIYVVGVIPLAGLTLFFVSAGWWLPAIGTGVASTVLLIWARRTVAEQTVIEGSSPDRDEPTDHGTG